MSLEREEVRRIAALARLDLAAAEEQAACEQLGKIVEYFGQLARFDTAEPVPEQSVVESAEAADEPGPCMDAERWLENAPQAMDGYLVVPRVKASS